MPRQFIRSVIQTTDRPPTTDHRPTDQRSPTERRRPATSRLTSMPFQISVSSEITVMKHLRPVEQKFILHWGEMGTRWGISRTVAQVHALVFLSPQPLTAEDIQERLGVARSNVSTSLKELQGWGIVRRVHVANDRRDHFESLKDVHEIFRMVIDERKKREMDPTLAVLRECLAEAEKDRATGAHTRSQMKEMLTFFETVSGWYDQVKGWPTSAFVKLAGMGTGLGEKWRKLLGI